MIRAVTVIAASLFALASAEIPSKPSVSVAVKESNIDGGLEGLDLNWAGVYKVNDFTLGFKYALDAIRDRPQAIYLKKSFDTFLSGRLNIETEYNLPKNTFSVVSDWVVDSYGLILSAAGDAKNKLTKFSLQKSENDVFGADKLVVKAEYDLDDCNAALTSIYTKGDTGIKLAVDSKALDTEVTVSHSVEDNTFSPSVSLKTGSVSYGWLRKWEGGSLDSKLNLGEKLTMTWKDEAKTGVWKTTATVPLDDSGKKTKISVSRDWAI